MGNLLTSGAQDLLAMAETLHVSNTGAGDPLDDADEAYVTNFFRRRLASWSPSTNGCAVYDEAVRGLLVAVLAETDQRRAMRIAIATAPVEAP